MGRLGISAIPLSFWDPLCISEANQRSKLRFGVLVGIYGFYGYMYTFHV